MREYIDVSIIIVSYNTSEKTLKCINSIKKYTMGISYEIIVSDNGSTDGTQEIINQNYDNIIFIQNGKNLGFGKANNIGHAIARGKYILYLNSDTELLNNAVKIFYDYWEKNGQKEHIGAIGAQLLNENGEKIHSAASFPTYKYFCKRQLHIVLSNYVKAMLLLFRLKSAYYKIANAYRKRLIQDDSSISLKGEVGYITGADLFLKNDGMAIFNPQYFMYCEETELELNMARKGLKRVIIEGPKIVHIQGVRLPDSHKIYGLTDVFKDISAIIYSENNLKTKARFLKFLVWLDGLNPRIRPIQKKAIRIIKDSKIE